MNKSSAGHIKNLSIEPSSTLALHLNGRIFNISAFVNTELPFLSTAAAKSVPLYHFYSHLFDWPFARRLNDLLKLKYSILKAKQHSEKNKFQNNPNNTNDPITLKNLPSYFVETPIEVGIHLPTCQSNRQLSISNKPGFANKMLTENVRNYRAARSTAFLQDAGFKLSFKRTWAGVNEFFSNNPPPKKTLPKNTKSELFKLLRQPRNKMLQRSIRDSRSHLSLSVLRSVFSVKSLLWPEACLLPWIITIDFYGMNDLPLGLFLEHFCFRAHSCFNRDCNASMIDHIQRFTQTSGCVELRLQTLESDFSSATTEKSSSATTQISMWTTCSKCSFSSPIRPMSVVSWHLSYMKFLDLLLNSCKDLTHDYVDKSDPALNSRTSTNFENDCIMTPIQPNMCRDSTFLQHKFSLGKYVATFSYHSITVFEVSMPPIDILVLYPQTDVIQTSAYASTIHTEETIKLQFSDKVVESVLPFSPPTCLADAKIVDESSRTVVLRLPEFLCADAYAVIKRYCEITGLLKSHLLNLKLETDSDELILLTESFQNYLNYGCGKTAVEARIDIIAFLIDSSNDRALMTDFTNISSASSVYTSTESLNHSQSPDTIKHLTDLPSANLKITEKVDFHSDFLCSNEYNQVIPNVDSLKNTVNLKMANWKKKLINLNLEEKASLLNVLVNLVKRWLFSFTNTWNSYLAQYNLTSKNLEKISRENRMKGAHSNQIELTVGEGSTVTANNDLLDKFKSPMTNKKWDLFLNSDAITLPTVTSGVLRILNSILPSTTGSKLFPEACLPCEHPQLLPVDTTTVRAVSLSSGDIFQEELGSIEMYTSVLENISTLPNESNKWVAKTPIQSHSSHLTSSINSQLSNNNLENSMSSLSTPLRLLQTKAETPCSNSLSVSLNSNSLPKNNSTLMSLLVDAILFSPLLSDLPDVYVNDTQLTSIIAYAFTTSTYSVRIKELLNPNNVTDSKNDFFRSESSSGLPGRSRNCSKSNPSPFTLYRKKTEARQNYPPSSSLVKIKTKQSSNTHCLSSIQEPNRQISSSEMESNEDNDLNQSKFQTNKICDSLNQNPHIEVHFSDSTTTFFCQIYYAAEFHNLRKLLFPQGENSFLRSLMHCQHWDARGGKSGSDFLKTRDERFIVKEVSTPEMRTFHEIHLQYFSYLTSSAIEQRLSILTRIVGLFHVSYKNTLSGDAERTDVLVMENLFHNRPGITQIYDLKGSLRGRLIPNSVSSSSGPPTQPDRGNILPPSEQPNVASKKVIGISSNQENPPSSVLVLLDQNFINNSLENPIYLRVHSKNALMYCLNIDSRFLADLFIMDYSLLIGIDTSTNQINVGIIDYLRKFTLNKRLEMFIKQTITSAQGPMPTIITPEDYRERLLDQMERNFLLVPDQWYDSAADHFEAWRTPSMYRTKIAT